MASEWESASPEKPNTEALPPHSEEAERGVLGCVMLAPPEVLAECVVRFKPGAEVFFDLRHRAIYSAALDMFNEQRPIDILTLTQELRDLMQLDNCGGVAYLAELANCTPSAANLSYYIDILLAKYSLRKLIQTCHSTITKALEGTEDASALVSKAEQAIDDVVAVTQNVSTLHRAGDLLPATEQAIAKFHETQGQLEGLPTGLADLDKIINGLRRTEMIVIAARPSCGKTSLAMNIAEHVSVDLGIPVGFFSLEMSAEALMFRLVCGRARVNQGRVRAGQCEQSDFAKLAAANTEILPAPFYIDEEGGLSVLQLKSKARRLKTMHGVQLLVVDYLQLMHGGGRHSSRQEEVGYISKHVKSLAKELDVPIIVLAQLNREMEKGGHRKPRMSDLRESGSIEQDADVVAMLYPAKAPPEDDDDTPTFLLAVNALVAKNRNGTTGEAKLAFIKPYTRFQNLMEK